jgi:hypothetical protein
MDSFLTKDDVKLLKGLAIVLMFMLHLWAFPERIVGGELKHLFRIFNQSSIVYLGYFGDICVSMFYFLGGYGLYKKYCNKPFDIIEQICGIYKSFWKVFFVMIPIAFVFFREQVAYCENIDICVRYNEFNLERLLQNLTGVNVNFNYEWWFLIAYVFAIITFPVIRGGISGNSLRKNIAYVVIGSILVSSVFPSIGNIHEIGFLNNNFLYSKFFSNWAPYTSFIACFWMGMITAENGILDRLNNNLNNQNLLNPFVSSLGIIIIIYLRQNIIGKEGDIFFVVFMVVFTKKITDSSKVLRNILLKIGFQSTNMWLVHSFLCYYFGAIAKIIVYTRWAVPSLIVLLILSYICSICIDMIWNVLKRIIVVIKARYERLLLSR